MNHFYTPNNFGRSFQFDQDNQQDQSQMEPPPKNMFFTNDFMMNQPSDMRPMNIKPDEDITFENPTRGPFMEIETDNMAVNKVEPDFSDFVNQWNNLGQQYPLQNPWMRTYQPVEQGIRGMDIDPMPNAVAPDSLVANNFIDNKIMKNTYAKKFLKRVLEAISKGVFDPNFSETILPNGTVQFIYTLDGMAFHFVENNPGYKEYVKKSIIKIKLKNPQLNNMPMPNKNMRDPRQQRFMGGNRGFQPFMMNSPEACDMPPMHRGMMRGQGFQQRGQGNFRKKFFNKQSRMCM